MKELFARREYLVAQSEREREDVARCAENVARFFSRNMLGRAVKSSVGTVTGFLILRWVGRKLGGLIGNLAGRKAVQFATGFWDRLRGGAASRDRAQRQFRRG